ncbi:unnamed protein product [Caretta caretta]
MCGRARTFYTGLFSPDPTDPNACRVLWDRLPTVSTGDRDQLQLPLTLAEFLEALRRIPTNKSPGMDGLTVEFYQVDRLVLREPELWLVLLAYADDMFLVVQDPGDLAQVEACQTVYSAASST